MPGDRNSLERLKRLVASLRGRDAEADDAEVNRLDKPEDFRLGPTAGMVAPLDRRPEPRTDGDGG